MQAFSIGLAAQITSDVKHEYPPLSHTPVDKDAIAFWLPRNRPNWALPGPLRMPMEEPAVWS